MLRQHVCPRCGRLAVLLPWPFSRERPRYLTEACRPCIDAVRAAVAELRPC